MTMTSENNMALTHLGEDENGSPEKKAQDCSEVSSGKDLQTSNSRCNCCRICCSKLYACCKPCMTKYNPQPEDATRCQRFRHAFLCPPHGKFAKILTLILSLLLIWATCVSLLGPAALPGGNLFGIFVLFVMCSLGGQLVNVMRMPPLLGKLKYFKYFINLNHLILSLSLRTKAALSEGNREKALNDVKGIFISS